MTMRPICDAMAVKLSATPTLQYQRFLLPTALQDCKCTRQFLGRKDRDRVATRNDDWCHTSGVPTKRGSCSQAHARNGSSARIWDKCCSKLQDQIDG